MVLQFIALLCRQIILQVPHRPYPRTYQSIKSEKHFRTTLQEEIRHIRTILVINNVICHLY